VCKTLYGNEKDLYVPNFAICFPNGGRQFYIVNQQTNQFRRFRLVLQNDKVYSFKSEDGIHCIIKKEIFNP